MSTETPIPLPQRPMAVLALACMLAGPVLAQPVVAPSSGQVAPANDQDPLESFNRSMFDFNDALDRAVLKPLASGYQQVVPSMARTGISNAFANLGDAWSFVNNSLQLKLGPAGESLIRFGVNTLFGFAGLIDIASELGIERQKQDFGLTLAHYGVPSGPYLVLPLLGPSTLRDTAALPVDWKGGLLTKVNDVPVRNSLYGLRVVDQRSQLLRASEVVEEAALDKYSFIRDAYLQRRAQQAGVTKAHSQTNDGAIDNPDDGAVDNPEAGAAGKP